MNMRKKSVEMRSCRAFAPTLLLNVQCDERMHGETDLWSHACALPVSAWRPCEEKEHMLHVRGYNANRTSQ